MIGEACRFYGWTDEYALKMPASRFFAMLQAAQVLRNKELVLGCYQSRASSVSKEGFTELVDFFNTLGIPQKRPADVEVAPRRALRGEEARAVMARVFGSDHRTKGTRRIQVH